MTGRCSVTGPATLAVADFTPKLDWSDHPGPLGGMLGAVEMCNNNGTCRAFDAGVMCPSFRVTRDEQHLTRGRANTLRLALTGQLGAEAMQSEPLAEAMKLCVSCKACRRECPTGVDMAKMKIEVLAARADRHGVGRREQSGRGIAQIRAVSVARALAGECAQCGRRLLRRLMERQVGLAAGRTLPEWSREPFRDAEAGVADGPRGAVFLLADTFNRYFEPENLRAALRVLHAAGYGVVMPVAAAGVRCAAAERSWPPAWWTRPATRRGAPCAALAGDMPVLGLEPSCLLTLRDEFRSLLPGAESRRAGRTGRCCCRSSWRRKSRIWRCKPLPGTAHVHGHCHQKSFGAFPDALAALKRVPELTVKPIASSCCGMAGSFGYQAETQDVSRAMAEAGLLPAVRAAATEGLHRRRRHILPASDPRPVRARGDPFGAAVGSGAGVIRMHHQPSEILGFLVRGDCRPNIRRQMVRKRRRIRHRMCPLHRRHSPRPRRPLRSLGCDPERRVGIDRLAGSVVAQRLPRLGRGIRGRPACARDRRAVRSRTGSTRH